MGVVEGLVRELGAVDRLRVCVMGIDGMDKVDCFGCADCSSSLYGAQTPRKHLQHTSPPVPSWLVKSPPCAMNPLMMRWNVEPLKCSRSPVSALVPLYTNE